MYVKVSPDYNILRFPQCTSNLASSTTPPPGTLGKPRKRFPNKTDATLYLAHMGQIKFGTLLL